MTPILITVKNGKARPKNPMDRITRLEKTVYDLSKLVAELSKSVREGFERQNQKIS